MNDDYFFLTFFLPSGLAMIYFAIKFYSMLKVYRKIVNPDYPILPRESTDYIQKDAIKYLKKMPIMPFLQLGTLFQNHSDKELNLETKRARLAFFGMIFIIFSSFIISIIIDINR